MAVTGNTADKKKIDLWVNIHCKFHFYCSVGEHFNPNNSLHGGPDDNPSKRVSIESRLCLMTCV